MNITVITTFEYDNNKFKMVQFEDKHFGGINYKYITNGKLNRELNGLTMFYSETLEEAMKQIIIDIECEKRGCRGNIPLDEFIKHFDEATRIAEKLIG